jgi:hypothetical protein
MAKIGEMGRAAQRLGVSTQTLAGFQFLAGESSEAMDHAMFHLGHELGMAANGAKETRAKFSTLGLDAKELAALPLDEAFGRIADRVRDLPSPIQQATAAYELFGRKGAALLPILLRGSEGIAKAKEAAMLSGLGFSPEQFEQVRSASLALKTIKGSVEGVFRQAAIGLAPYIEAAAGKLNGLVKDAGGIGPLMDRLFEGMAKGLAEMLNALQEVIAGLKEMTGLFKDVKDVKENPAGAAKKALGLDDLLGSPAAKTAILGMDFGPFGHVGGLPFADLIGKIGDARSKGAQVLGNAPRWGDKLLEGLANFKKTPPTGGPGLISEQDKELTALIGTMQQHKDLIGKTADQAKVWELEMQGASKELVEVGNHLALVNKGLDLKFAGRSELEKLRQGFEDVGQAADAAGLTDEERGRSLLGLLGGHDLGGGTKLAGALEGGSSAAQSVISQAIAGSATAADPVTKLQQLIDLMARQDANRSREAREIAEAVRAGRIHFQPQGV